MGKYSDVAARARAGSARPETVADKVIDDQVIPKKIPPADDVEGQTAAIGGALASALLTASDMPIHVLAPFVGDLSAQLVALGVRQTDMIDVDSISVPTWISDGVKQHSVKLPPQPEPTEIDPAADRVAVAPNPPKRIAKSARAVRL